MAYPNGKKSWVELDLAEKWEWHSQVYAWRHLRFGAPIVKGSAPTDPDGHWFDEAGIQRELAKLKRAERPNPAQRQRELEGEKLRREGVAICNAWARERGFPDFAAAEAAGHSHVEVLQSLRDKLRNHHRTPDFNPTADELAAARAALGLTATEAPQPEPEQEKAANA